MVPNARIGLAIHPYHGCVIPLHQLGKFNMQNDYIKQRCKNKVFCVNFPNVWDFKLKGLAVLKK